MVIQGISGIHYLGHVAEILLGINSRYLRLNKIAHRQCLRAAQLTEQTGVALTGAGLEFRAVTVGAVQITFHLRDLVADQAGKHRHFDTLSLGNHLATGNTGAKSTRQGQLLGHWQQTVIHQVLHVVAIAFRVQRQLASVTDHASQAHQLRNQ